MATHRNTRKISREEGAYIAGLIDGEGTIALTRRHRAGNRQLVVSISNTELKLLRYVQKVIGAGRITSKRTYRAHHTPSHAFAIENRQALALLEKIAPYLKTYKAKRAGLVLRDYLRLTPRNGKYTPAIQQVRQKFIEKFMRLNPRHKS
jgi:LAGLIDADG-like domain